MAGAEKARQSETKPGIQQDPAEGARDTVERELERPDEKKTAEDPRNPDPRVKRIPDP